MSTARRSTTNIIAGLFVIASIAIGVALVIILSGIGEALRPKTKYIVRFSVLDGADGLEAGSFVKVGGQKVGRVLSWDFTAHPPTSVAPKSQAGGEVSGDAASLEPMSVDVEVEIDSRIKLWENATAYLVKPLLGASAQINIPAVGMMKVAAAGEPNPGMQGMTQRLESGEILLGELGPPAFVSASDYARVRKIIADASEISEQIKLTMPDVRAAVSSAEEVVDSIKLATPEWTADVTDTLENARKGAEQFPVLVEDARGAIERINKGVEDARTFIASAQKAVDDNRANVDETIASVRRIVERAETEWGDKITRALDSGNQGLESFVRAGRDAESLLAEKLPELRGAMTDAALAAQQMKLTMIEVRASPWRVLYQPTKKELENELLYNSVREYSDAVSRLRQAADALDAARARAASVDDGLTNDELAALATEVRTSLERYRSQEKTFLDKWLNDAK
jgi:ABC-type transporter Mla subunit MlaD